MKKIIIMITVLIVGNIYAVRDRDVRDTSRNDARQEQRERQRDTKQEARERQREAKAQSRAEQKESRKQDCHKCSGGCCK